KRVFSARVPILPHFGPKLNCVSSIFPFNKIYVGIVLFNQTYNVFEHV
ncbi:unnamed protein product, partial [Callosobruchus maculatus]